VRQRAPLQPRRAAGARGCLSRPTVFGYDSHAGKACGRAGLGREPEVSQRSATAPGWRAPVRLASAGLTAVLVATSFAAVAQDQRAAIVKDVIFARKTLMNFMCDKMTDIETMIATGRIDMRSARRNADAIAAMFLALPHLFPPGSNQWNPNATPNPETDTYASPEVWTGFANFYRLSAASAQSAHDMSRAANVDEFKSRARELRIICDECHALYSENQ
jgi:cytochrome c556